VTSPEHIALGPGREFDAIRSLLREWAGVAEHIGDDAALLEVPRGERLVASVDACIENRHFRREWLTPREIGYRAVAAASSDLAAMAARPLGILIALAVPDQWRADLDEIGAGIADACRGTGARILGGNTTAAGELSITTTVLGSAFAVLERSTLRPGDTLYLTGSLGASGAALHALRANTALDPSHRVRFARPQPRIAESQWLARAGAHAAIDVSDGLAVDLAHLAAASGVTIEVHLEDVPVVPAIPAERAVASGEEYELVVGARAPLDTADFAARFGLPLTRIGLVREGDTEVVMLRAGVRVANVGGYDHFTI
jgi:thiamine-monophosphate kinase